MSTWMFWIIFFIDALIALFVLFMHRTIKNLSDLLTARKKEYESEKGRNLATKEDIAEITKSIEEVKSSVAISSQRRYEQKKEQEKLLIDILRDANEVAVSRNKLMYYQYDTTSRARLDALVDSINDCLIRLAYESNLAEAYVDAEGIHRVINQLEAAVSAFGIEICVDATNSATFISQIIESNENALSPGQSKEAIATWVLNNKQAKDNLEKLKARTFDNKEKLQKAIAEYRLWLKDLYGRDFFMPASEL